MEKRIKTRLWGTITFTLFGVFIAWILYEFGLREVAYFIVLVLPLGALLYIYNASAEEHDNHNVDDG